MKPAIWMLSGEVFQGFCFSFYVEGCLLYMYIYTVNCANTLMFQISTIEVHITVLFNSKLVCSFLVLEPRIGGAIRRRENKRARRREVE